MPPTTQTLVWWQAPPTRLSRFNDSPGSEDSESFLDPGVTYRPLRSRGEQVGLKGQTNNEHQTDSGGLVDG